MAERGPTLDVRVLGPLEARVDGVAIDLGGKRPRAVFALLVLAEGRVVSRERLIEEVWSGNPPDSAVNTLQSYVSSLRRVLGAARDRLETVEPGYRLRVEPDEVDASRFEAMLRRARTEPANAEALVDEALSLWRGTPLADLGDEPFARAAGARFDELRLAAIEDQQEAALATGRHADIVSRLDALVEEHPLRERLAGQLVLALYRSGRQADALRAYERLRRRLAEDLGINPSRALQELEQRVLDQDRALDWVPADVAAPAPATPPAATTTPIAAALSVAAPSALRVRAHAAFVGRDEEAARLDTLRERTGRGGRHVAAVVGEAGIGKTRLVGEFARRALDADAIVLWGRCTPEPLTAFQPFVEAFRPVATAAANAGGDVVQRLGPGAGALAQVVPELGAVAHAPAVAADTDRYLLFEAAAELLGIASSAQPVVLVLDDMHWADRSTAALLLHLVRHPSADRVLFVTTYRPGEVQPALASLVAELRRDRAIEVIELGGLDASATDALVCELVGHADPSLARAVQARTDGNPFYVEELVAHAVETGASAGDLGVPSGVRDVIGRRLATLDPECRRVLAAAAVLGPEFDVDVLAPIAGVAPDELVDHMEAAIDANLVVERPEVAGRLAFVHALVRDALYESTSGLRRAQLHRAAAAQLESRPDADGRLPEIAHHVLAAGSPADAERAVDVAHRAANRALAVLSYEEAVDLCERAVALLDARPDSDRRLDLLLTLGQARAAVGDVDGARGAYLEAAAVARELGDPIRLALAALGVAIGGSPAGIGYVFGVVDWDLVHLLDEAANAVPPEAADLRIALLAQLSIAIDPAPAELRTGDRSIEAVELAQKTGVPALIAAAFIARRTVLWRPSGPLDVRLRLGERAADEADRAGDVQLAIIARLARMPDLLEAGDLVAFDRVTDELESIVNPLRQPRWYWFVRVARAGRAALEGRYDDALRLTDLAYESVGGAQGRNPPQTHALQHFMFRRDVGTIDASTIALLQRRADEFPGTPLLRAMYAVALWEAGDTAGARREYDAILGGCLAVVPDDWLWLGVAILVAELAAAFGDAATGAALDALLEPFSAHVVAVGGAGVLGPVARGRGFLALARDDAAAAVEHFDTAVAQCERLPSTPWAARTLADLAAALDRAGRADGAAAALSRAESLAGPLGLRLPALTRRDA